MSDSDNFNPDTFEIDEQTTLTNQSSANKQRDDNTKFHEAKLKDLIGRPKLRIYMFTCFICALFCQYYILYHFIDLAFEKNVMTELQWSLCGFFGGLFSETYLIARLMIQWLFKDDIYKPDE